MRRRPFQLPPPPLSLFTFILTLIFYYWWVAPEMQIASGQLKLMEHTARMCSARIDCGNQLD